MIIVHHEGVMNGWIKFHGNPSNRCGDISFRTTHVNLLVAQKTLVPTYISTALISIYYSQFLFLCYFFHSFLGLIHSDQLYFAVISWFQAAGNETRHFLQMFSNTVRGNLLPEGHAEVFNMKLSVVDSALTANSSNRKLAQQTGAAQKTLSVPTKISNIQYL